MLVGQELVALVEDVLETPNGQPVYLYGQECVHDRPVGHKEEHSAEEDGREGDAKRRRTVVPRFQGGALGDQALDDDLEGRK